MGNLTPFCSLHLNIVLLELCRGIPHKFNHILSISLGIKHNRKMTFARVHQYNSNIKQIYCAAILTGILFCSAEYGVKKKALHFNMHLVPKSLVHIYSM